jgi:hypothetical protein
VREFEPEIRRTIRIDLRVFKWPGAAAKAAIRKGIEKCGEGGIRTRGRV